MTTVRFTLPENRERSTRRSLVVYLALLAGLALIKIVLDLASVGVAVASQAAFFSWPLIGFLALAGGLSVWLGPRAGLPELWNPARSPRKWLVLPAAVGLGLGTVNLAAQGLTGFAEVVADSAGVESINVPFPGSILFYSGGAIVVESLYRLILITVPLWLIGSVVLRGRARTPVFWTVAAVTSLVEAWGQVTIVSVNGNTDVMLIVGAGLYAINLVEAHFFWRHGFLAPLAHRIAFYLIWHGIGSVIGL